MPDFLKGIFKKGKQQSCPKNHVQLHFLSRIFSGTKTLFLLAPAGSSALAHSPTCPRRKPTSLLVVQILLLLLVVLVPVLRLRGARNHHAGVLVTEVD